MITYKCPQSENADKSSYPHILFSLGLVSVFFSSLVNLLAVPAAPGSNLEPRTNKNRQMSDKNANRSSKDIVPREPRQGGEGRAGTPRPVLSATAGAAAPGNATSTRASPDPRRQLKSDF